MTSAPLPPIDVAGRERRLGEALDDAGLSAIVVTSPTNIRWLTGFAGSYGTVVVGPDGIHLLTDHRYADRAPVELQAANSTAVVSTPGTETAAAVQAILPSPGRVALEADHVTWARQTEIDDSWLPDHELVATTELIARLRAVKDDAEVARIERAAAHVDAALTEVLPMLTERPTEREFAHRLEAAVRESGADGLGFDTIVAGGPNGAIPHHHPGDRTIEPGDLVIVDVGAMVDGYRSDMTRTFCVGAMSAEQRRHYDVVRRAQQAGVEAMAAGVATRDVDAAARAVIDDAGWADEFTHGAGHGVGLDIHELPRVHARSYDVYELGAVATVEPGVYVRGHAGVRVEDTCLVTTEGARRLTGFPKEPERLG